MAAAGGEASDRYPWQVHAEPVSRNDIQHYANTSESGLGTTPVCMYPAGQSSQGVMDMAGNVWEWQANLADMIYDVWGTDRALRGGSWDNDLRDAHVASRSTGTPDVEWEYTVGFRVVAVPVPL